MMYYMNTIHQSDGNKIDYKFLGTVISIAIVFFGLIIHQIGLKEEIYNLQKENASLSEQAEICDYRLS